jgi:hypothetical protein
MDMKLFLEGANHVWRGVDHVLNFFAQVLEVTTHVFKVLSHALKNVAFVSLACQNHLNYEFLVNFNMFLYMF